jgi:phosphoglycerol transferase MdoB-like AlkP superfamily enzyme
MKTVKNNLLVLSIMSFIIVIGGAVYEHLATVPVWSAAPPASLIMYQGGYPVDSAAFWKPIHPTTMLLLIAALMANWKTARRRALLITIGCYLTILVITFVYFVPELISITTTPAGPSTDLLLKSRADNWETLSLVRLGFLLIIAFIITSSLSKPAEQKATK